LPAQEGVVLSALRGGKGFLHPCPVFLLPIRELCEAMAMGRTMGQVKRRIRGQVKQVAKQGGQGFRVALVQ